MSALIGILNGKPVGDRLHSALDKLDPARIVRRDTRMFATHGAAAGLAAAGPSFPISSSHARMSPAPMRG